MVEPLYKGDEGDRFYMITRGEVSITESRDGGEEEKIVTLGM